MQLYEQKQYQSYIDRKHQFIHILSCLLLNLFCFHLLLLFVNAILSLFASHCLMLYRCLKLKLLLAQRTHLFLHEPRLHTLVMEPMLARRQLVHQLPHLKVAVTHCTFLLLSTMLFPNLYFLKRLYHFFRQPFTHITYLLFQL